MTERSDDKKERVMRWTGHVIAAPNAGGFVAYGDYLQLERELAASVDEIVRLGNLLSLSSAELPRTESWQDGLWQRPTPCACRFEWRPTPDFSGAAPKILDECGYHSTQRKRLEGELATMTEWWNGVKASLPVMETPLTRKGSPWTFELFYAGYWYVKKSHAERAIEQAKSSSTRPSADDLNIGPHGFDSINCPNYYDGCKCEGEPPASLTVSHERAK